MENIIFDSGVKEYRVNNGDAVLRVNFADPGVFDRIFELEPFVLKLEADYIEKTKALDELTDEQGFVKTKKMLRYMTEIDQAIKIKLTETFGAQNDFNAIFGGVNVMAFATNGKRVIANFLEAISPIIQSTVESEADKINAVVGNRKQRAKKNDVGPSDNG